MSSKNKVEKKKKQITFKQNIHMERGMHTSKKTLFFNINKP